jgi:hypothetical protein
MVLIETKTMQSEETIDEFLARGGRIERIEDHPDPDGRVLLRGQRERQFNLGGFRRAMPVT